MSSVPRARPCLPEHGAAGPAAADRLHALLDRHLPRLGAGLGMPPCGSS
ncbi:hypothetical protein [Streptomyces sp. NPDC048637]